MTSLSIILLVLLILVSIVSTFVIRNYRILYKDFQGMWFDLRENIKVLTETEKFNGILNVDEFNVWFNSPKDPSIYAHPGIFLRIDKLGKPNIDDFILYTYKGLLDSEDFDFQTIVEFEDRIRKDWFAKQREL